MTATHLGLSTVNQILSAHPNALSQAYYLLASITKPLASTSIASAGMIAIWACSSNGTVVTCNDAMAQYFNRRQDDVVGRSINELAPEKLATRWNGVDRRAIATGQAILVHEISEEYGSHEVLTIPIADRQALHIAIPVYPPAGASCRKS